MLQKNILWVRLDAIGDAILASSMLRHLYDYYDHPRITALCEMHGAQIYETSPFVERVIPVEKMKLYFDSVYRNDIVFGLQKERFDIALDTTCSWNEMADLFVVGSLAKEKIAFENLGAISAEMMEKRRKVFTRLVKFERPYEPEMDRYRVFLRELGINVPSLTPAIWTTQDDEEHARSVFAANALLPEKTVAMFAFGRSHLRTYRYYGEALADVCKDNGFSVVALGDGAAYGFNQTCLDSMGVHAVNLSGKTTLRQAAAVMKMCRIAVGAETGLAHMACAVGIPNVIVIGGGHAGRFMPYTAKTSLVTLPLECFDCDWHCRYKRAHCVNDVAPEVIGYAVRETLRRDSERPRMFVHPQSKWAADPGMPAWELGGKFLDYERIEVVPVEFNSIVKRAEGRSAAVPDPGPVHPADGKPAAVESALSRATALRDDNNTAAALAVLEETIAEVGQFPDIMNLKAELLIQDGMVEEARQVLWNAALVFPFDVRVLNNIAVVEILQHRYDSAIGMLERVLDIEPGNETASTNLRYVENNLLVRRKLIGAEQSILNDDLSEARNILDELLQVYPDNEDALADLAVIESRSGNTGEAVRLLQRVLAANPRNEFASRLMAKMLFKE